MKKQPLVWDMKSGVITGHKKYVKQNRTGWNHNAKNKARKWVWEELLGVQRRTHTGSPNCMTLVGDGKEIPLLVKMGIPESRIWAVDRNPDMLDRGKMKWIDRYPGVNRRQRSVSSISRLDFPTLDCVHLDFCSSLSNSLISEISYFCQNAVLNSNGRVAVTFVRAREIFTSLESKLYVENYLKRQFEEETWRAEYIVDVFAHYYYINYHATLKYQTKSPMQVVVMELRGVK